jgi:hypothetical protein
LCLVFSTKVRQFFGSKFFDEKRSTAGDRNFKDISLENTAMGMCWAANGMCWAANEIPKKGFAAWLGSQP